MARRAKQTENGSGNDASVTGDNSGNIERNPGEPITIDPTQIGGSDGNAGGSGDGDANSSGSSGTGDAPRKRGRPRGSTNRARASDKTSAIDVSSLEVLLYSTHQMLAAVTHTPEFAIEENEAKELAKASANVARHYDMGATQKTLDWSNLIQCLALIYGTRIYAIRVRKNAEKEDDQPTDIVRFPMGVN